MLCNSKENSIKFLAARGATNDVRKIINLERFDELNDQITKLAEIKYGLNTMGAKLFSIAYEQTRYLKDTPIYRESTYTVPRAIPNEPLFQQLDVLRNEREGRNPDSPMMMREGQTTGRLVLSEIATVFKDASKFSKEDFDILLDMGYTEDEILDKLVDKKSETVIAQEILPKFDLPIFEFDITNLTNARAKEIANVLIERLTLGLKVNYANITQAEAREILKNSPIPYQGEPAFFFAGSVYIVDENVTVNTVLHEFSHPLIEGINKTNSALFNNLYLQLSATIEGKKLVEYVKTNYPELAEGTDRFKREVLTYGLQLAAQNKVANQIASKGFDNFIKNLLFQIKQLLKNMFGNKVNVAKLNESTTLEELADMLLEKDFVFDTEKVTYDDAVAFARNQIERINILTDNASIKAITDAINALFMTNLGILNIAKNFKTNKKTREILIRTLIKDGTTELTPGIKNSLQGFQTVIKGRNQSVDSTIEDALNAEELRLKDLRNRAVALVSSLELTNNSVKLIRKEISLLAQKKNFGSRSDIALIGLYKGSLTRWFQSVSDIYNILTEDFKITTDNDFSQLLNEISTNVSEAQKTINDLYKEHAKAFFVEITGYMSDFVKEELKTELGNILKNVMTENEFEDLYNAIVQQKLTDNQINDLATQKGIPVQYLNRLVDRYNYFVINETKINDILEGKFKDVSILNRFMESYSSSTSPIVGSLSIFIENQKNQAEQKAWEKSSKFRAKLEKLLPAIAQFSKWNTREMLDLMSSKDSIAFFDKKQNKMVQREVYTFLNEFGNGWRHDLDMLEYKIDEARKNGDLAALKAAELELRQFNRDFMHDEYVAEFYEKDDIFERSPVAKQAWLDRKLALDEYSSEANKLHNEAERFEAYSTTQEAWRKYQLLYSLYNEDGTQKTGEELEKTKILLEHRALTRDFYEFIPIPGSLQTAYNEFVNLKRAQGVSEEDLRVLVAQWEKQNTRLQYKPEFYEERTRLLNRLRELQDKQDLPAGEFNQAEAMKTIYDLIYGFKDEQGQPDPNALGEDRLAEIKDLQQQVNNFRFENDNKSGLSRNEIEELRGYASAQRVRNLTAAEQSRYLYLIQKQSTQGLTVEEAVEMQSIISELADLTFKIPTEYYLDELNYNLSKFNIEAVNDENVDEYINSEDFIELVKSDKNFYDWFLLNHVTKKVFDKGKKKYVNKFERTLANTVTVPRDTTMIETTKILDTDGNDVTILGVPNSRHSIYTVKDKYRTIPFGLTAAEKKQYIGKIVDNKGNYLPRIYDGTKTGARTNKYMNEKFFNLKKKGGKEFELLELIKEYHLSNQEGTSNMAKLYMDVPRYAIDTVVEAFQAGQYGDRYRQLKGNASEFWAQMFGKSKVDFQNGFNYNAENNLVNTDLNGEEISYIPVTGLYNLESDKVSPDIFQGLMRYALSLEIHDVLLENLPLIQSLIDTLSSPEAQPKNLNAYRKDMYNAFGALQNVTKKGTTNQMLGQLKSLFEREFYGVQQSQNSENYPRLTKALSAMQKASSVASLAVNIPSDLKNKYGAMVQLIIEAAGAEFIGMKDLASGRAWAYKAMMNWSSKKGIYAVGPGALTTQLVEIFNPVFRSKENTGRSVTRSLYKDLVNGEWMYMHRKFGEMEVGLSLFGAFINAQKVEQTINGKTQTIRYIDAWETNDQGIVVLKEGVHPKWNNRHVNHVVLKGDTISSIAKQYGISTEELKAKNRITTDVELIEGEEIVIAKSEGFDLFRNQVQGTSRYLFGAYDDFGQPEGNKYTVYRLYMFMRKWFTTMFTNRFGAELIFTEGKMLPKFNARYDWALGKPRKGYYITAFEVFINMLKSRGENLKYKTNEEKIALRKVAAESLFVTGFALMAALLFGYDDDDEDKWKKIAERSEALGTDGYKTFGYLQNHMLALLMGTQAETTAFIPLPKVGGVQFGLDDYGKMLSQTSTSFGNTILLYSQIFQDFFNMITFSGGARYKKDSGPYPWEQEGQLKIVNDVLKTFGFTGSTGDPETIIKNIRSSGERIGR
jgi:LysM repeat protein